MLGGAEAAQAAPVLRQAGLEVRVLGERAAEELRAADEARVRYTLVHVGRDDGEEGGSYARAHHRVTLDEVAGLAERLRPRERKLVTVLSFAYKDGMPDDAAWLVDVRFLDNPYWIEELRDLDGHDPRVRAFVLKQARAQELLDRLEALLRWALPLYQRPALTIAFGCTGGRHRSVVLAVELAQRLKGLEGVEVELRTPPSG